MNVLPVGNHHASVAGADVFSLLEAEHPHITEGSGMPAVPGGADYMGAVFDHENVVLAAQRCDFFQFGTQAPEVRYNQRFGVTGDGLLDFRRVHQVGVIPYIDELRHAVETERRHPTEVDQWIADHFVTATRAGDGYRLGQPGHRRIAADAVPGARKPCKCLIQLRYHAVGYPAEPFALEHLLNILQFHVSKHP